MGYGVSEEIVKYLIYTTMSSHIHNNKTMSGPRVQGALEEGECTRKEKN